MHEAITEEVAMVFIDLRTSADDALRDLPRTVIVGSGAAGIALALALEEAGRPVLLVESGGEPQDADGTERLDLLNDGQVVGHRYAGLRGGRSRTLGGATQLWLGQCTRLLPLDLEQRPWVAGSGWPIDANELARWYDSAESWFEVAGGAYGAERWSENPKVPPVPWDPKHLEHDFTEYTDVLHLGDHHRRRLERSESVRVLLHATATRVLMERDGTRGIEVRDIDGRSAVVAADSVVLACGAVENARLLMLSDPDGVGLGTGKEHTGRYLQDHPVVETLEVLPFDPRGFQDRLTTLHGRGRRLYPKVRLSPAAQREHELLNANACFLHHRSDPRVLAAKRLVAGIKDRRLPPTALKDAVLAAGAAGSMARAVYRRKVHGVSGGPPADRVVLQVWMEQAADPASRLTLGDALDPFGQPVVRVDWRLGDQEMRTSRTLSAWIAEDLRRLGLADVRELPPMTDDDAWRDATGDAYHPSGTTRMSAEQDGGVVDPDCRVHGLRGLYVAGSSTFPVAGFANPTLTTVALALRLADHLVRTASRADAA